MIVLETIAKRTGGCGLLLFALLVAAKVLTRTPRPDAPPRNLDEHVVAGTPDWFGRNAPAYGVTESALNSQQDMTSVTRFSGTADAECPTLAVDPSSKSNLSIANKTGYIVQFTTGTVPPVFEDNVALANDTDGLRVEPELATPIVFAHNAFVGNKLGVKVVPPGLIPAQAVELTDGWVVGSRGRSAS